ncbi:MAG: hypothetical protein CVT89_06755 [Candidatus Altiarchaeales archaeon HGW-Altiarchaeales-2]|nr:MAG: hypothetical protein CVT89_06755 [Candidatus Altiarchaeales archaeon HGW-Altiarchaeales-2]
MEKNKIVDEIVKTITEKNIKFMRLQFSDLNGKIKSFAVSTKEIENIIENGQSFDGSSVTGFGDIEESDMLVKPDVNTFVTIPWRPKEHASARMICDIYVPDGKRFEGDPRYIAQKISEKAKEMGFVFNCAPEYEFFIFKKEPVAEPMDSGGYFDYHPAEVGEDLRREMAEIAEHFGIEIEVAHHEVAPGQHEMDFKYGNLLLTADRAVTLASFMPKPIFGINGSGMHVHQSLWDIKENRNAFFDKNNDPDYNLSDTALHFIGGQIKYTKEMIAILASWPNSYKRLVPGYEAPVHIAWGFRNRSPLLRVPDFGKRPNAARVEIRCPDPAGNTYLQLAVLCAVGLRGIKEKIAPPEPTDKNVYNMSFKERRERGIDCLPDNLGYALREFENSELMREILGDVLFESFLQVKMNEWEEYSKQITDYELKRYLETL